MKNETSLVVGGAGFLGSSLCEALAEAGQNVRAFDRIAVPLPRGAERIEWARGDFFNPEDLRKALKGCRTVFHLVSTTVPGTSNLDAEKDVRQNIEGSLRLIELALAEQVRRFIFVSSGGTVYGVPGGIPIREDSPTNPICSYGICKLAVEKYLHMYHATRNLDYCVLRLSNLFGERQSSAMGQGLVNVLIRRAIRGEPVEIWGRGDVVRDYIYVKDAAEALVKAADHGGEHRVFNIGSGRGRTVLDVIESLELVLKTPIKRVFKPARAFDVPVNVLDISLAAAQLGWRPRTDWLTAIESTCRWVRDDMAS